MAAGFVVGQWKFSLKFIETFGTSSSLVCFLFQLKVLLGVVGGGQGPVASQSEKEELQF